MPTFPVNVSTDGNVGIVRLDDPDRRNILTAPMVEGLSHAFDDFEVDDAITCVVVTGEGTAFCAGAELATLERSAEGDFESVKQVYEGFLRVLASPLPTIAAVNGAAVGAGMNLALACDVRVASERAMFDSRFAALRLHPGGGHTWLLQRAVGYQRAVLGALFGERWDAVAALDDGLVAAVHPPERLIDEAVTLGKRLEGMETSFVRRLASTLTVASESEAHADVLAVETAAQAWSVTQPSFVENVRRLRQSIRST